MGALMMLCEEKMMRWKGEETQGVSLTGRNDDA
jgi:hypothetical protein